MNSALITFMMKVLVSLERMRVIGLTGGIASGKSTAARILAELGARVVDADQIARDVVARGQPALAEIAAAFGDEVLLPDGTLDRKRMGALVFADPDLRRKLNAITHPRIAAATQARLGELRDAGEPLAVYEAALMVENGAQAGLDGLIVVACAAPTQRARLMARDGLTGAEADARLAAQLPLADKIAVADWVIDSNGTLAQTHEATGRVWAKVVAAGKRT
jgi:dephospho-CoA kinase